MIYIKYYLQSNMHIGQFKYTYQKHERLYANLKKNIRNNLQP